MGIFHRHDRLTECIVDIEHRHTRATPPHLEHLLARQTDRLNWQLEPLIISWLSSHLTIVTPPLSAWALNICRVSCRTSPPRLTPASHQQCGSRCQGTPSSHPRITWPRLTWNPMGCPAFREESKTSPVWRKVPT